MAKNADIINERNSGTTMESYAFMGLRYGKEFKISSSFPDGHCSSRAMVLCMISVLESHCHFSNGNDNDRYKLNNLLRVKTRCTKAAKDATLTAGGGL